MALRKDGEARLMMETREARRLFLYGDGDGKRILGVTELSRRTGVSEGTIRKHYSDWEKEFEGKLQGNDSRSHALALSAESLDIHKSNIAFLEDQMAKVKWEIEQFDDIIASLQGICDNFSLNTDNGDHAVRLFENYLSSRYNMDSLRRMFLTMQKQHSDLTGVRDLMDIQATITKEREKGRVKMDLRKEAAAALPRNVTPDDGKLAVFDRS